MHFFGRQSRAGLVQNLHFGKPALLHWNPAQHASSFCFTSSPTMHWDCVAVDDTPHQPAHSFVRVISNINSPFFTNGMPSMQIGFVQAFFSRSEYRPRGRTAAIASYRCWRTTSSRRSAGCTRKTTRWSSASRDLI